MGLGWEIHCDRVCLQDVYHIAYLMRWYCCPGRRITILERSLCVECNRAQQEVLLSIDFNNMIIHLLGDKYIQRLVSVCDLPFLRHHSRVSYHSGLTLTALDPIKYIRSLVSMDSSSSYYS